MTKQRNRFGLPSQQVGVAGFHDHTRTITMTTPTMNTRWGHDRIHLTVYVGQARHDRLQKLAEDYGKKLGRPVSLSLLIHRALDLLDNRLVELDDPQEIITERLAVLGPARLSLQHNGEQHET